MLPASPSFIVYVGNNSTVTSYPIPFRWDDDTWIELQVLDAAGDLTTLDPSDYTLTGAGDPDGGGVVTNTAIPNTSGVFIFRNTVLSQEKNFPYNGRFSTVQLTAALDKLTMALQDQARDVDANFSQCLRYPGLEEVDALPAAADRAGTLMYFDEGGDLTPITPNGILALSNGAADGVGIPAGGTTGQALVKSSDVDYAAVWGQEEQFRTTYGLRTYRPYVAGPNQGLRAFKSKLDQGQGCAIKILSDSTGAGPSWPYIFATTLAADYPAQRFELFVADINGTNAITKTVLQAAAGRRNWRSPVGVLYSPALTNANMRTSPGGRYFSMEIEVTPAAGAALTGGYPTADLGAGQMGDGTFAAMFLLSTGRIEFQYYDADGFRAMDSDSGGANLYPQMVAGTYVRYRVRLDTANGANRTATFAYSTNEGATWTQMGSPVSQTKATNSDIIFNATPNAFLGLANAAPKAGFAYSYFQCGKDANFEPCFPEDLERFAVGQGQTANTFILEGSPTCKFCIVAVNGAGIAANAWFVTNLPGYAWNLLRDYGEDACLISTSHNDVGLIGAAWATPMDTLRTLVASRLPSVPAFYHIAQNPETTSNPYTEIRNQHNRRCVEILSYAARKGSTSLNFFKRFYDDGRPLVGTLVEIVNGIGDPDGVHPTNPAGQGICADVVYDAFLDSTNEPSTF